MDRKLRSMSENDSFIQRRNSFLTKVRGSLPVAAAPLSVRETPEEYENYLSPIPVYEMYAVERTVAAVGYMQGAFSSVKIARELSTSHLYAVKITPIQEDSFGRMAIKEFQVLSDLSHPCILKPSHLLIDLSVFKAYMFMPMLTEITLSDVLAGREEALSEGEVRDIARQMTGAMAHMHGKGVIHRDVNPNNVMYEEGKVVLIDFQTCTRYDPNKWMMSQVGTGSYSAPEMKSSTVYE